MPREFALWLNKLQLLKVDSRFWWHHPAVVKTALIDNHQNLLKLLAVIVILLLLLLALFKPISKEKPALQAAKEPTPETEGPKEPLIHILKTNTSVVAEETPLMVQQEYSEPEFLPLELSLEEEQSLHQAMTEAGQRALAESIGDPHQAELKFQKDLSDEAARQMLGGKVLSKKQPKEEVRAVTSADVASSGSMHFILIYVMAPRSSQFNGNLLFAVLRDEGLRLNNHHVFEYLDRGGVQFYVTSALKPGVFNLHDPYYAIPGINFILDLSLPSDPRYAYAQMLAKVNRIASRLQGDILDDQRERLTEARLTEYMARVKGYIGIKRSS